MGLKCGGPFFGQRRTYVVRFTYVLMCYVSAGIRFILEFSGRVSDGTDAACNDVLLLVQINIEHDQAAQMSFGSVGCRIASLCVILHSFRLSTCAASKAAGRAGDSRPPDNLGILPLCGTDSTAPILSQFCR